MLEESGSAINWKKVRAEELLCKGYSKEDIGLLEFLKEDCLNKDVLKVYLERYIHNEVTLENENKRLREDLERYRLSFIANEHSPISEEDLNNGF